MKTWAARSFYLALCILLLGTVSAFGAVSMTLVNANANYAMGGVYTSPYGLSVNGGATTLMICDDFLTNVYVGQTWQAQVTSLADVQAGTNPSGTPKFGNNVANYATAAVLAAQLMGLGNFASAAAGEISYAIWGVFDPTLLTNNPATGEGHLTSVQLAAAQQYLADARAVVDAATQNGTVNLSAIPYLTIYTPDPLRASQEFLLVSMPEPAFIAILFVESLGMLGFVMFLRRRRMARAR
jgi:hypothetical protein